MNDFSIENNKKIKPGFKIPDNYFENFSENIMHQLPVKKTKSFTFFKYQNHWKYAVAAMLFISISIPLINNFNTKSEIADENIENYMTYNTNISEHDLASLLDETDIQQMKIDLKIEDKTIENELSEDSDLEQYLIQ
jgi:preprotein translocase subunit SecF